MQHIIWNADPVLFSAFGITIYWYGLFFAIAILSGLHVLKLIYIAEKYNVEPLDSLLTYSVIGIIVGARLGHCFFYDPTYYLSNPLKILAIWEGGLASHGGGIGILIAMYLYVRKFQLSYIWLIDRLAISTALFGVFVRFGNFINSEILGVPTTVPWGIIFARIDEFPRHPAQLYESVAYLAIFILLVVCFKKFKHQPPKGLLTGLFLTSVFSARLLIESVKVNQESYSSDLMLNTGQLLSLPFLIAGILFLIWAYINHRESYNA